MQEQVDVDLIIQQCAARFNASATDARRLLHGRGQLIAGLEQVTVDHFPPYGLVRVFQDQTIDADYLSTQLQQHYPQLTGTVLQNRAGRATQSRVLYGEVPERFIAREGPLNFWIQPMRNQNCGLFLDMAPLREWLVANAAGARVLNLFAYTCSLSVAALAGNAAHVVNNDMSRTALEWGSENHVINQHDPRRVSMLPHNVFKSWWKIRQFGPYDIIIVDPPTNQRGSFVAEKNYAAVLRRLGELSTPGAQVFLALNSPFLSAEFLPNLVARHACSLRLVERCEISADFSDRDPDRGLKLYRYQATG